MQAVHKALVVSGGQQQLRFQNFLLIIEFFAVEAVPANMFKFSGAGLPLIQQPAPPVEINAALGEARFFFKDVVNRYPVVEVHMRLMGAPEDVVALIVIYYGS